MGSSYNNRRNQGNVVALRLVENPQEAFWELHRIPSNVVKVALLGWVMNYPPVDAGVPEAVAGILSRALCRSNKVTFLHPAAFAQDCKTEWCQVPAGWARVVAGDHGPWFGRKRSFPLLCTSDPETAVQLFYQEQFAWELRNQFIFLSRPDGPPLISYQCLAQLLNGETIDCPQTTSGSLPYAAVLPAVDGDFAEMIFLDEATYAKTREQLAQEGSVLGINLQIVSETEFKNTTWFGEPGG